MRLEQHISQESLNHLVDDWKSLTAFQRKTIRLRAQYITTRSNVKTKAQAIYYGLPMLIRNIQLQNQPYHFVGPNHFAISRRTILVFAVLFSMLFFELITLIH